MTMTLLDMQGLEATRLEADAERSAISIVSVYTTICVY
jgi:hypothetical protein